MTYTKRVMIAIDQLFAVVLFGTMPDETVSAWAHRCGHKRTENIINWLFNDELHCAKAYISEMAGEQNASEYI